MNDDKAKSNDSQKQDNKKDPKQELPNNLKPFPWKEDEKKSQS